MCARLPQPSALMSCRSTPPDTTNRDYGVLSTKIVSTYENDRKDYPRGPHR